MVEGIVEMAGQETHTHKKVMPRTIEPVTAPNQYLRGDILCPSSDPTIAAHVAKGRSVSGRSTYRLRPQKRASSLVTKSNKALSKSWDEKEAQRLLKKEVKEAQSIMITERIEAKRLKRQNRLDNEKRRMDNEYRNAKKSMQTLNAGRLGTTMRNMNKKQLRQIKKSRMNSKTGVVEFVGAYEK